MASNPDILVCERVGDIPAPPFKSAKERCSSCAREIHVALSSIISMPKVKRVCVHCARAMLKKDKNANLMAPNDLQKHEIKTAFPRISDDQINWNNKRRLGLK